MNPRKETRFALVLNGGVSLAVWMGGVTHELNRLRLASAGTLPSDPREAAVHRAWVRILERADRTAVVDTIAGTSAGGLNGAFLATAVAGGKDLTGMREIWSEVASVERGKLLSKYGEPHNAVLDGTFFRDEVAGLLDRLHDDEQILAPQDCTLLMTATALNAEPVQIELENDSRAHMMDSRRVYRFRRRTLVTGEIVGNGEKTDDDFDEARTSIALASRASASFPIAFAPVLETPELRRFRVSPPPGRNAASGAQTNARSEDRPRREWLIDGGVLDNAPFGPLMKTLRERAIGEPFERVVLYVTPSPGAKGTARDLGDPPKARRVLKRVVSALREPDLRLDYEALGQAFTQMGYTLSTPHDILLQLLRAEDPKALITAIPILVTDAEWFKTYRTARSEAIERELSAINSPPRFMRAGPPTHPVPMSAVPDVPTHVVGDWQWGLATAVRALRWWGRALVAYYGETDGGTATVDQALAQIHRSQRKLAQLSEQLETSLQSLPPSADLEDRVTGLNAALDSIRHEILGAVEASAGKVATVFPAEDITARDIVNVTLAVEVASAVLSWGSGSERDEPAFDYLQVTPAATPLVDLGTGLVDHPEWLNRKLYGERLGHFGAFLSKDDRLADWRWGRLDGASALCDYFLGDSDDARPLKDALTDAILAAEDSSSGELQAAATRALETGSWRLLRDLEPRTLSDGSRFLWDKAGAVVRRFVHGEEGPAASGAPEVR